MKVTCYKNVLLYGGNKRIDAYQEESKEYECNNLIELIDILGIYISFKSIKVTKDNYFVIDFRKFKNTKIQIRGEILNE